MPAKPTSLCYKLLQTQTYTQLPYFTRIWREHLDKDLEVGDWKNIFQTIFHAHSSIPLQEINYKFITKWYTTPVDIHRFDPNSSPVCWRCNSDKGTFQHIWWSCGELSGFWKEVWNTVNLVVDTSIPFNPEALLLFHFKIPHRQFKHSLVYFMLTAAKSSIVNHWKSAIPPSKKDWFQRIEHFHGMEELRWGSLDKYHRYKDIWQPWKELLRGRQAED
ncbi:Hypothetical predicted protein [Pelobates cultripes]|uniref:Reverse transcriptase zinc-binding domain-containing protein n=1 Tax=Pelobates cultripes TaxID=61616 RepID=A0AAD1WTN7_PELCU|nr:Hypothetical predicted protein [Pelobates cultripes]